MGLILMPRKTVLASVRTVMWLRARPERICHSRMRHALPDIIKQVMSDRRYCMTSTEFAWNYTVCAEAKQSNAPATRSLLEESEIIAVHTDICGSIQIQSRGGNCYFMTMTTTPQRFTNVQMFRKRKIEAQCYYDHIAWVERNSRASVLKVCTVLILKSSLVWERLRNKKASNVPQHPLIALS